MAEVKVDVKPSLRFFCHRCYVEFEDVLPDYTCPYCVSGFIEQLEPEDGDLPLPADDFSYLDMSNLDDNDDTSNSDDSEETPHLAQAMPPMSNDMSLLMPDDRFPSTIRRESSMSQILFRNYVAHHMSDIVPAETPFEYVGDPDDYVSDGERLDDAVTQLLGQLENSESPSPTLPQIQMPNEVLTENVMETHTSCSVCWEKYEIGETVSRLECNHLFHARCISLWMRKRATCPICRRSLQLVDSASTEAPVVAQTAELTFVPASIPSRASTTTAVTTTDLPPIVSSSQLMLRRLPLRGCGAPWSSLTSSSSSDPILSATSGTNAYACPPTTSSSTSNSSSSFNVTERMSQYNLDIDYD